MPDCLHCAEECLTFDELREAADLIIHQTACILSSTAQGTKEELTSRGVAPQLCPVAVTGVQYGCVILLLSLVYTQMNGVDVLHLTVVVCCCISSSLDKHGPGTTQMVYT